MPDRAGVSVRRLRCAQTCVAILSAIALGGCGATPPQAPVAQANRVASALTGIASACGEAYQQRSFSGRLATPALLQASAQERASELAHVFSMNPAWIYQGQTLRQVVALSISYLRECGLTGAAALLLATTSQPAARSG